jgi:hypothetical protein
MSTCTYRGFTRLAEAAALAGKGGPVKSFPCALQEGHETGHKNEYGHLIPVEDMTERLSDALREMNDAERKRLHIR